MSLDEIHAAIPHRPPFLLVDEIVRREEQRIVCRKTFRHDEWYFAGHYPGHPIVPGVILCEAAMQAGAILLSRFTPPLDRGLPVAARMNDVRFKRVVRPGETIEIEVEMTHSTSKAWFLKAKVTCEQQVAARLEFACAIAPPITDAQATG
ncbi:MAG: 3-hydroxyacyl-ACP dehydratase FabZ family protein [Pirellulales bacterium]